MIKPMNYAAPDLLAFADQLLQAAGLPPDKAQAVADVLGYDYQSAHDALKA